MRKYLLIGVSAFVLGAGSMAYVSQQAFASAQPRAKTYRMLELFGDVLDTVERQYVSEIDDKKLIEAAIDGMLTSLDPHSGYLNPESFDEMRDQTRGEYGGLGIEVTSEDGVVKVISPMDGTPAFTAGVKAGDFITAVNGESVLGLTVNEAVKQMRGKPGEAVTLTIAREKTEPFDVKIVREVIKPKSALARMEARIVLTALLRRNAFPILSDREKPVWENSLMVRRHEHLPTPEPSVMRQMGFGQRVHGTLP
jgi:carboxyl-terminal processing protease